MLASRLVAVCCAAFVLVTTGCYSTYIKDERQHNSHTGYVGFVSRDTARDAFDGAAAEIFGDISGVGAFAGIDYRRFHQEVMLPEFDEPVKATQTSMAATFGMRVSPIGIISDNYRSQRIFDFFGEGGFGIGGADDIPGISQRAEAFVGVGGDLRLGVSGWGWFPLVTVRYRVLAHTPDYAVGSQLLLGIGIARSESAEFYLFR